jgi:hypothetical protein
MKERCKAIEMVEPSGGVVEDSEPALAIPPPHVTQRLFSPIKKGTTMPRPTRNRQRKPQPPLPQDVATAETRGLTPLAYMLAVMRNPKSSQRRRDRMAVVAARYIHRRPADDSVGKKQELLEAAREAGGADSEWADDLLPDGRLRQ